MDDQFDILSDVLNSLRICGSLLMHDSYHPPWAIALPAANHLGKLLGTQPGVRVVPFHLVERGYIDVTTTNLETSETSSLVVEAGEMVICFGGQAHQLSQGNNPPVLAVEDVLAGGTVPFRSTPTEKRGLMSCVCGVFYLHDTHLNPLFAALPPVLLAPVSQGGAFHSLSGAASLLAQELAQPSSGSNFMVERLLELLCARAVRTYMNQTQSQDPSWLTGLRDPVVSRALALVHGQPGEDWSVNTLANQVALSPSRFSARFKETLGESPMGYVAKWRIHVASRLLSSTEKSISEIASEVGYENLAAFNRAFKRHLEMPPGMWRSCQWEGVPVSK